MSPDTQQNILYTIFFVILHNYQAILFSIGVIVSLGLALYKPTRAGIIMMWGFIILLFAFEYSKHILEPLKEQTTNSLITVRQSYRIERTIHLVLDRLIPLGLPLLGWLLVIGGGYVQFKDFLTKPSSAKKFDK